MLDTKQHFKLRKLVNELKAVRGRHTELVTVYIPAGYDIIKIVQHLVQEQGTASNIKDNTTRQHVIDSLERMVRHLRLYKQTPANGLAAFAGNLASQEGKTDLRVWSVEPPLPINIRMYRCDQTFVTDELEQMLAVKDTFGLIVMDNREATIGLIRGKSIQVIKQLGSNVPGKLQVGGFSQARYARLKEEAEHEFYKRIADIANTEFLALGKDLRGILIGGPGPTKESFHSRDYINNQLKKIVIGIKDIAYTDESGLHELVNKSQDILAQEEIIKEKKLVQEILELLAKNSDKIAYGFSDVKKALEMGAVEKVLISEEFKQEEELEQLASNTGAQLFIISTETKEGVQLRDLGGVAAVLRYKIDY
ncbi:MAG: peptide chain release factor aRF-1 [Nanoarchaeota archaeon]